MIEINLLPGTGRKKAKRGGGGGGGPPKFDFGAWFANLHRSHGVELHLGQSVAAVSGGHKAASWPLTSDCIAVSGR